MSEHIECIMKRAFTILIISVVLLSAGIVYAVPPTSVIIFPADGSVIKQGVKLPLKGLGNDPEDKRLKDDKLDWKSDKDGILGNGETLPVLLTNGIHIITLTVTDSEGLSSSSSVTVTVKP